MARRIKPLTPRETEVLAEVDRRPGSGEQVLAEALGLKHVELTFYLATLIGEHLVAFDEIGKYGARQYRVTTLGHRRHVLGQQLTIGELLHA